MIYEIGDLFIVTRQFLIFDRINQKGKTVREKLASDKNSMAGCLFRVDAVDGDIIGCEVVHDCIGGKFLGNRLYINSNDFECSTISKNFLNYFLEQKKPEKKQSNKASTISQIQKQLNRPMIKKSTEKKE